MSCSVGFTVFEDEAARHRAVDHGCAWHAKVGETSSAEMLDGLSDTASHGCVYCGGNHGYFGPRMRQIGSKDDLSRTRLWRSGLGRQPLCRRGSGLNGQAATSTHGML